MKKMFLLRNNLSIDSKDLLYFNVLDKYCPLLINFEQGDILIHKNPYEGESPKLIIDCNQYGFLCAHLDSKFNWQVNYHELIYYSEIYQYYEKINNFHTWLNNKIYSIKAKFERWKNEINK